MVERDRGNTEQENNISSESEIKPMKVTTTVNFYTKMPLLY